MKRAFGSRGRMGGGGVGTVREVGGVQEALSTTTRPNNKGSNSLLSLTSTSSSPSNPVTSYYLSSGGGATSRPQFAWHSASNCLCDRGELEWVHVHGGEEEEEKQGANNIGLCDGFGLGPVPSEDEVEEAISVLKHVTNPASFLQLVESEFSSDPNKAVENQFVNYGLMQVVPSTASELDWIEPSFVFNNPMPLESHGDERVQEAFHLLQTEPLVQRIVLSLSTDKAVWEAVLNNEVVRELRDSSIAEDDEPESSDSSPGLMKGVLKLVLDNFMAKIMVLAEKLRKLVNEILLPSAKKEKTGGASILGEKLVSSLLLSIIVLLIVVLTRVSRA